MEMTLILKTLQLVSHRLDRLQNRLGLQAGSVAMDAMVMSEEAKRLRTISYALLTQQEQARRLQVNVDMILNLPSIYPKEPAHGE